MDIAIMGAGLSGLSCAITLEKNGICPTIFEKRSQTGDRFVNGEVLLSIFAFPVHDCIASLSDNYGIFLKPSSNIERIELHSKNEKTIIEGNIGFTNIRGREQSPLNLNWEGKLNHLFILIQRKRMNNWYKNLLMLSWLPETESMQ